MIMNDRMYSKSHEWVLKQDDGSVRIGLTDYAQQELGDLVFADLPQAGDDVTAGESCCEVESVKAVSPVYSPVSGKVRAVNEELLDAPESINEKPYEAWLVEVEDVAEEGELMDAAAYEAFIAEEK